MADSNSHAVRIDHQNGLSQFLTKELIKERNDLGNVLLFFDFDRCLTNGEEYSKKEEQAIIDKRVRGGQQTVDALYELKKKGASFHIVTARSARLQIIQQLKSSLTGPQSELGGLFDLGDKPAILNYKDSKLATAGTLFATGYHKELAIGYVLSELIKAREKSNASTSLEYEIYFFDDAVVNSHSVLTTWVPSIKVEPVLEDVKEALLKTSRLTSVWWDPFFEETEVEGKPTMIALHSESSDFNYHEFNESKAKVFDLSKEEVVKRRQVYLDEEKKYGKKPPSSLKTKPPPAKKMKDVNSKFQGLSMFLSKRP